ncbi:MAG: phosphate ABC transporter ATP-binding protein, partial [Chloroflexi bacterium]|nr:phosphate ABC transporter ATP-binding protein [Chloroflexota bacterium]
MKRREPAQPTKITVQHLNVHYGKKQVLADISIEIKERQITALIGPSGCGKSTFLRCLNRMNDAVPGARIEGEVLLDGENIYNPRFDVVQLRQRVGMVFQRPNPFPQTIYDNVAFGPRILGIRRRSRLDEIVEQSLREVNLWDEVKETFRKQNALSLSLGQQQRLCIARTIATRPEVILMDEPASALDPIETLRIEDLMRALVQDYTIVIVTHNMQQAARVSDWTAFFLTDDGQIGKLVEYGETGRVFTNPRDQRTV